jgi:hypothetical protein
MKFKITPDEAKVILEMHSKMKSNGSTITEQTKTTTEDPDIAKLKSAMDAGCLTTGGLRRSKSTGKVYYRKPSIKQPGKTIDYFADMTYKFTDGSESGKWKCDGITQSTPTTPQVNQQQLTPQQQKSVDDLINTYNQGPEPRYKKEEPTADQMAKQEWTKVNLKDIPAFKDIGITFDYYVWEKTGLRQTQSPQQKAAIKTYTDAGWQDIGGKVNPAEADKYDTIDLIDIYPDDFKESYKLVKPIESVDTNELIEELNTLVGTKNFSDRKTCRNIISKYNLAKQKDAPINAAVLLNWKIAVNACNTKVSNFNDLDSTKSILRTLTSPPKDKKGNDIKDNDIPVSDKDKKWAINIRKKETPKENQPAAGATQPVAPTAGAPTN